MTDQQQKQKQPNLNPLADDTAEANQAEDPLDEVYYKRLNRELTRDGERSGMISENSRVYTEEDLDFPDDDEAGDDDYDDKEDLYHEEADKAEEYAEQYENRRAGAWKRKAGPKARGQKVQEYLEKLREVTASLNAVEQAARAPNNSNNNRAPGSSFVPPPAPAKFAASLASKFDPKKVLAICEKYDEDLDRLLNSKGSGSLLTVRIPAVPSQSEDALVAAYDHMIDNLYTPTYQRRFNCQGDEDLRSIHFGGSVPGYFANVGGESIFRRKMLSILGLRNLIKYGPTIFSELRNKLFAGNVNAYASNSGLNLMKTVTGNLVDLDTVVLRLSDHQTMDAVNMMKKHKGERTYASLHEFASSEEAQQIGVSCATSALQDFIDLFKLTESAARARRVLPSMVSASSIPVATTNADRGNWPLWRYQNAGQDSFHANVPNISDVIGALLLAPFHCIKHYAFMALQSCSPADNNQKIDIPQPKLQKFFEECVQDSCFNMKWKAIESYGEAVAHEGTIVDILQKLQMDNQAIFTQEFFGADDDNSTKEKAKMFELVSKQQLVGKEASSGKIRPISQSDVDRWVADPGCKI